LACCIKHANPLNVPAAKGEVKLAPNSGDARCYECKLTAHGQLAGILHGRQQVSQNKFRGAVNFTGGLQFKNK
jgi:hypothetical protein